MSTTQTFLTLPTEVLNEAAAQGIDPDILARYAVHVCSIHNRPLRSGPHPHGGKRKYYVLPAADSTKGYSVLALYNTFEAIMDTSSSEEEITSNGFRRTMMPIASRMIAEERVKEWAGDHISNQMGGHIGVGIIAGPTPTKEELAELHRARKAWATYMVQWADAQWADPAKRYKVKFNEARDALGYMGATDSETHPWFSDMEKVAWAPTTCPACGAKCLATAFRCQACNENIAQYYLERGLPVPDGWVAVEREVKFLAGKLAKAAIPPVVEPPKGAAAIKP